MVPVVTLSTQDNAKLFQQFKSGFKRIVNCKYQSKVSIELQEQYLYYLIDPSFQEVNVLFVLLLENNNDRAWYMEYLPPIIETKDYNVMTDDYSFLGQPVKIDLRSFDRWQQ